MGQAERDKQSARLYADGNPIAAIAMYPLTPTGGTGAWQESFDNVRCTPSL